MYKENTPDESSMILKNSLSGADQRVNYRKKIYEKKIKTEGVLCKIEVS